jgi:hypothetical protein
MKKANFETGHPILKPFLRGIFRPIFGFSHGRTIFLTSFYATFLYSGWDAKFSAIYEAKIWIY